MLYKETVCKTCNDSGFVTEAADCTISSKPCPDDCHILMTNGDLIRCCTNEQLQIVYQNLKHNAIYSGGYGDGNNRLLFDTEPDDFIFWLNKPTDDLDLRTIFDFIDEKE